MAIVGSVDQLTFRNNVYEIVPEIAPLFQETESYDVGDWVIYEATLYKFISSKSAGAWDATKVDGPSTVMGEINAVSGVINMTVSSQTLPQGASATVTKTEDAEGIINLAFGLPLASGEVQVVNVSGANPTITAEYNKRYVCGEVSTLTIIPASQGCTDVLFTSGTTPTVLSLPNTVKMPSWFSVEANKTYEINILDGVYGSVMSWT